MASLLVFEKSFDPGDDSTWPNARRLGQTFCGERLSHWLGQADDGFGSPLTPMECVYRALSESNDFNAGSESGTWGLWIEYEPDVFVRIRRIRKRNDRLVCAYKNPAGDRLRLVINVVEDDDSADRRMTVVIPEDRNRVTGANPYVVDVATDVDTVFDDGSGSKPLDAGYYVLSSVTFRRCA